MGHGREDSIVSSIECVGTSSSLINVTASFLSSFFPVMVNLYTIIMLEPHVVSLKGGQ